MLFALFDTYEAEAKRTLEAGKVLPAYDYVLKCSHAFNLLDARGAISVTERTRFIGRVRDLARLSAQAYLAQREAQGFPLLKGTAMGTTEAKGATGSTPGITKEAGKETHRQLIGSNDRANLSSRVAVAPQLIDELYVCLRK